MRTILAAGLVLVAGAGAGGQEKKAEPKYDTFKELDRKAKATLELVKKRGDGYVDKGIAGFGEVVTRADPKSEQAQRIAGQAVWFMGQLYQIKRKAAVGDDEAQRIQNECELWLRAQPIHPADNATLPAVWAAVERGWIIEDLRKK
jgi:hypothetical protein